MRGFFKTDKGQVRHVNEDYGGIYQNKQKQSLAIVADGMGGHQAGEVASQLTGEYFSDLWQKKELITTAKQSEEWLLKHIENVNLKILEYAQKNEKYSGMGTTIVAAICTATFITVAHVGDSRAYLLNRSGFKQLTEDHSLINELVKSGEISELDAQTHPKKNVLLKALGTNKAVKAKIKTINWEKNDRLLLCSDGLSNKVTHEELKIISGKINSEKDMKQKFVDLANARGGEDNISIALIINEGLKKVGDY